MRSATQKSGQNREYGIGGEMNKIDFRRDISINIIFRITLFILSIFLILMGIFTIVSKLTYNYIKFDTNFKFGIAALGWGIILFIVSIRTNKKL